jgi:hypothetical protein
MKSRAWLCMLIGLTGGLSGESGRTTLAVHGVVEEEGGALVSVIVNGHAQPRWLGLGETVADHTILAADARAGTVTFRDLQGGILVLPVRGRTPGEPSSGADRWVLTEENPQFWRPHLPPRQGLSSWTSLDARTLAQYQAYYASHGWRLVVDASLGTVAFELTPELRAAQLALRQKLLDEFAASLPEDLRRDYENVRRLPMRIVRMGSPESGPALLEDMNTRAQFRSFLDRLPPPHRENYEAIRLRINPRINTR